MAQHTMVHCTYDTSVVLVVFFLTHNICALSLFVASAGSA